MREWWDDYRTKCWDWEFREIWAGPDCVVHSGHFLKFRGVADLEGLKLDETIAGEGEPLEISVPDEIKALKDALEIPILQASGVCSSTKKREKVPAELWQDLEFAVDYGRDIIRSLYEKGSSYVRYDHVAVPLDALMQLWPPRHGPRKWGLPPLMRPDEPGYMPLFRAAQWIATEGGAIDIDPKDVRHWENSYRTLLDHVASGQVRISGVRDGLRQPIDGTIFADCLIDYPYQHTTFELVMSEEYLLLSHDYVDEETWRRGFDDRIENRHGKLWTRLMVDKLEIAAIWPFGLQDDQAVDDELLPSGAPGRPSVMHIVVAEFERRCAADELEDGVVKQSRVLAQWLCDTHPTVKPLSAKAIENKIRADYRRAKNPRN